MKVVELKQLGTDTEPLILELRPDMTAGDILAEADLADCCLVREAEPMRIIPREEVLFDLLTDCETLIAKAPVKFDPDKAREEMWKYVELNDDPSSEPIDTSDSVAYMRRWFKEG
jgi:hypothetical protein